MGPQLQYTKELYQQFGYWAAWAPGTPVELGDVGTVQNNIFSRFSTLKLMGLHFDTRVGKTSQNFVYTSKSGVEIQFKAAGSPLPVQNSLVIAKAGAVIDFKKQAGVVFVARACKISSVEDQVALGDEIIHRYQVGDWDPKYVVVTEVVRAQSLTVFISEVGGGRLELVAEGRAELGMLELADVEAKLSVAASRSMNTQIMANSGVTPLFRVRRVQKSLFGSPSLGVRRTNVPSDTPPSKVDPKTLQFAAFEPELEEGAEEDILE